MGSQSRGSLSHWIAKDKAAAKWDRLAKGIEGLDNNMNPQESTKTFIDDSTDTTTTGFQPSWTVSGDVFTDDTASEMLHDMAWKLAKNNDATLFMIEAREWKAGTTSGTVEARMYECAWLPDSSGGGSGGESVTFSGTLKAKGDPVFGDFNTGTTTFTPAAAPKSKG